MAIDPHRVHAPHLRGLFAYLGSRQRGAQFAQDELLDEYLARLDQREIFALIAAIDSLLRGDDSDAALSTLLREFGLTDVPAGADGSVHAWLRDLRHQLAQ